MGNYFGDFSDWAWTEFFIGLVVGAFVWMVIERIAARLFDWWSL